MQKEDIKGKEKKDEKELLVNGREHNMEGIY